MAIGAAIVFEIVGNSRRRVGRPLRRVAVQGQGGDVELSHGGTCLISGPAKSRHQGGSYLVGAQPNLRRLKQASERQ